MAAQGDWYLTPSVNGSNFVGVDMVAVPWTQDKAIQPESGFFLVKQIAPRDFSPRYYAKFTGSTIQRWGIECPTVNLWEVETTVDNGSIIGVRGQQVPGEYVIRPEAVEGINAMTANRKTAALPTAVAGDGAYATNPNNSGIKREVAPGTIARATQAYMTWAGTKVYDWQVDGLDGDWSLGGNWSVNKSASRKQGSGMGRRVAKTSAYSNSGVIGKDGLTYGEVSKALSEAIAYNKSAFPAEYTIDSEAALNAIAGGSVKPWYEDGEFDRPLADALALGVVMNDGPWWVDGSMEVTGRRVAKALCPTCHGAGGAAHTASSQPCRTCQGEGLIARTAEWSGNACKSCGKNNFPDSRRCAHCGVPHPGDAPVGKKKDASRRMAAWTPPSINSADDARNAAIDWQYWQSEQSMSWGEVAEWESYFAAIVARFPELAEEFAENGIVSLGSRRTAASPEGWWPVVPGRNGESSLVCPGCESANVTISGSNLGSDLRRGNPYSTLTCGDCGRSDYIPLKTASRRTAAESGTPEFWDRFYKGDGVSNGVPRDLFPEGGVPLHGELTPEQEAWLKSRASRGASKTALSPREFYCDNCEAWTPVAPTAWGGVRCERCGDEFTCGECGYEIDRNGVCERCGAGKTARRRTAVQVTPNESGEKTLRNGWVNMKGEGKVFRPDLAQLLIDMAEADQGLLSEGYRRTAANVTRDADGTSHWPCKRCPATVYRYPGESDVECDCGAQYNAVGQQLRDDWRGNQSNWDDSISDMDGYENQHANDDYDYSSQPGWNSAYGSLRTTAMQVRVEYDDGTPPELWAGELGKADYIPMRWVIRGMDGSLIGGWPTREAAQEKLPAIQRMFWQKGDPPLSKQWTSSRHTAAEAYDWKNWIGHPYMGFPGSKILSITPSDDYLMHGPMGTGPGAQAPATMVLLHNGREMVIPIDLATAHRQVLGGRRTAERDRAATPRYGDQTACRFCDGDIEYHGKEHGWLDRGGSQTCANSGHAKWDENGVPVPFPDGQKHRPYSDRVASRRTAGYRYMTADEVARWNAGEYFPGAEETADGVMFSVPDVDMSDFGLGEDDDPNLIFASLHTAGLYPDENADGVTTWADGYGIWHATADSAEEARRAIEGELAERGEIDPQNYEVMVELVNGRHYVEAMVRTADQDFGPAPDSQSGFGESERDWVTVDSATDDSNLGWVSDEAEEAYEMDPGFGPFDDID